MCAAYPENPEEGDHEVREDGTACHWLAKELWDGVAHAEGELSPNNRLLTEEMFTAVDMYHGVLRSWPNVEPVLEQTVSFDWLFPDAEGTPDAWAYNPSINTLYVGDLKYGFRFVDQWQNYQLILYSAALIKLLHIEHRNPRIEMTIVQPRDYGREGPIRTWVTTWYEIQPIVEWLIGRAREAMGKNPLCTSGPQCMECPGRHACKSAQQSAMMAVEFAYGSVPFDLCPEALGAEASRLEDAAKRIEARMTGLHMQIESLLKRGVTVPFYEMRESRTRRYFPPESVEALKALGPYFKVNVMSDTIKTVRQLETQLPKQIVEMYSRRPKGALKVGRVNPKEVERKLSKRK